MRNHLKSIVDSIITGVTTTKEKTKRIYNWVQDHVKYVAFEDGYGGFIPRDANLVCDRRFGDCKDMANLLVKMLNMAGVSAHHTWIGTRDIPYSYNQIPTTNVDNHMIAVFNDNGNVYLGGPIGSDTGLSSTVSIVGSNVGIGNVTPTTKLDVVGTTTIGSSIQAINAASSTASANYIRAVAGGVDTRIQNNGAGYGMVGTFSNSDLILAANGGTFVYVKPSGRVGIGNGSPAYLLDVNGDINAAGAVRASGIALTSDVRLKKNIVPVKNALSSVMQLNAVSYDKKESIASNKYNTSEIGFIAQDLRKVFPALVSEGNDADKTLAVNYAALIPVLTKAIQEQQAKISELTARNEASET
ncbi:MAG: hypothetical protein EOO89_31150, partial [Pedobacter sp.]